MSFIDVPGGGGATVPEHNRLRGLDRGNPHPQYSQTTHSHDDAYPPLSFQTAMEGEWTDYAPTWSGTISDGTITAAYLTVGRTVDYRISVVWGASTSHGAATQTLTLPFAPHSFYVSSCAIGHGMALNAGTEDYPLVAQITSGSTIAFSNCADAVNVTNAAPFTFGSADALFVIGRYEAAA